LNFKDLQHYLKNLNADKFSLLNIGFSSRTSGKDFQVNIESNIEVYGLVALLHKGGGSKDRASDYRPVVLLNSLFQLVSYVI